MRQTPWNGVFRDHPVQPLAATDPLHRMVSAAPAAGKPSEPRPGTRIGYACCWEKVPERTWSGSAWHLREGLRTISDTVDIGVEFSALTRQALRAVHTRYRGGRLTTAWFYSPLTDTFIDKALRRGLTEKSRDRSVDVVLQT